MVFFLRSRDNFSIFLRFLRVLNQIPLASFHRMALTSFTYLSTQFLLSGYQAFDRLTLLLPLSQESLHFQRGQ